MNRLLLTLVATAAVVPVAVVNAGTIFHDTFANSSVNSSTPSGPTGSSTAYQVLSGKAYSPTPSIAANDLQFGIGATSGGTVEAQALFSPSVVKLNSVGDYLDLTITFTDTSGILTDGRGYLGVGMYNSGGAAPVSGGLNGTLQSGYTSAVTGNAQNWQGYVGMIGYSGYSSDILDRQMQTGAGNNNQDLVTTGSSTYSYHNPEGSAVGSSSVSSTTILTAGSVYTDELKYTLTALGLQIDNNLYSGNDTSGSVISSVTGTAASPLTTSFDGLAIGYYSKDSTSPNQFDVNSVLVTATNPVPEPGTFALAGLGLLGFVGMCRRQRHQA